jgi:glycosyltransferase involved in cell wall biosynthesis
VELARSLTIIVPIHKPSHGVENFASWIRNPILLESQIILVHDASDGETFEPIMELCAGLSNVTFLDGNQNSPGLTRNLGLDQADREWVTFWDFDDRPNPAAFLEMLNKTISEKNLIGIGAFSVCTCKEKANTSFKELFRSQHPSNSSDLMINPGIWRWVFSRPLIGNTRFQSTKRGEDQLFLAEIDAFDYNLTLCDQTVYTYFIGDANQLSVNIEYESELFFTAEKFFKTARVKKGNTALFSRVAFVSSSLTYVKKSFLKKSFVRILKLLPRIAFTLLQTPKAAQIIFRRHKIHSKVRLEGKSIDLYLAGGLGNQLFQLAFACNYKNVTEMRLHQASSEICQLIDHGLLNNLKRLNPRIQVVYVNSISLVEKLCRNQLLRLSGKRYSIASLRYKIFRNIWMRLLNLGLNHKTKLVIPNGIGYDPEINFNSSKQYISIVGYFQSHVWAESIKEDLYNSLLSTHGLGDKYQNLRKAAEKTSSILVHIRLGDYLESKNSKFGVVTKEYVKSALDNIAYPGKSRTIILFSNEPSLAKTYLSDIEESELICIPNNASTLESLFLLTQGSNFVISNSTFSWWGAFTSKNPSKLITAPKPWFKEYEENLDLIPSNWIRSDSGW